MRLSLSLPLLLTLALGCAPSAPDDEPRRPDILLVSLDTLRADRLSCYGYSRDTSPTLDALAARGVRFAEVHAPSSNTKPSHMSLFTGLDPLAHDVRPVKLGAEIRPALAQSVPTMPELLKRAGYQTASFTDRGGLPPSAGFARGFDHERAEWEELPKKIAAVGRFLKNRTSRERPLFLFFHTYETHAPYLPPKPFHGRYTDPSYAGEFRTRYDELAGSTMAEYWQKKGRFLKPYEGMGEVDVQFASDLYDEEIAWTDHQMTRLFETWARARGDDTLIVVFSDHGEAFFEHQRLGHQRSLYAELMRVPLILAGGGLPAGVVVEEPVSLTGVLPTLLELLELPSVATQVPSFFGLVEGAGPGSPPVFAQMGNRGTELFESVSEGDLRLIRTTIENAETLELYDWSSDDLEALDLAETRAADVERLAELLEARRRDAARVREDHPPGHEGELTLEEQREIEALGYAGDD